MVGREAFIIIKHEHMKSLLGPVVLAIFDSNILLAEYLQFRPSGERRYVCSQQF